MLAQDGFESLDEEVLLEDLSLLDDLLQEDVLL